MESVGAAASRSDVEIYQMWEIYKAVNARVRAGGKVVSLLVGEPTLPPPQAAVAAARPGVKARDVDAAARKVITDAGYGEYFVHRTGHGLGIDIHEPPYITATSELVLDEGMVFSIEPGIYLPGRFGIRLEEIVILRKDGAEILSSLPRDVFRAKV